MSSVAPSDGNERVSPEQVFDFIFLGENDSPLQDSGSISSRETVTANKTMGNERFPLKVVQYVLAGAFFLLAVLVIVGLSIALAIQTRNEDTNKSAKSSSNPNLREVYQPISWGVWGSWSQCNQSCLGFRNRTRVCLSDLLRCSQQSINVTMEFQSCQEEHCVQEGPTTERASWSEWVDQTNCSVSCGNGVKTQSRRCQTNSCPGDDQSLQRTIDCNLGDCGTWSSWSEWGDCSVTCDEGVSVSQRTCEGGSICPEGESNLTRPCIQEPCPEPILCGPVKEGSTSHQAAIRWSRLDGPSGPSGPGIELRVVGGTDAQLNEFPWQVSIEKRQTESIRYHPFCGGVLLTELWVMTAAHCTFGQTSPSIQVALGEHIISTTTESVRLVRAIKQIVNHPQYNEVNIDFDISLLKLDQPVNFDEFPHIRPICFPSGHPNPGDEVILAGWGREAENAQTGADVLQKAKLPVLSREECLSYFRGLELTSRMFCAGYKTGGQDSCQGDSGGPLILKRSSNYEVVGLVSYGLKDCGAGPAVYTKVTELEAWWRSYVNSSEYPRTAK